MNELRSALRSLAKAPGFTLTAFITLALGIGLSTGAFSTTNAFLLRDVPYPESQRLVRIHRTSRQSQRLSHAPANLLDTRAAVTSFSTVSLFNYDYYSLGEAGQPAEQVNGLAATADFFTLLRVQPVLGRGFAPGEDQPDQPRVAVITHRAWMRWYGGDPSVIGRQVRLNTLPYTVVGVLSPSFDAPLVWGPVDFVIPRTLEKDFPAQRTNAWMSCVARLKPGVSLRQAQAELDAIAARLDRQFPKENGSDGLRAVPLHDSNMDDATRMLLWLMTALALTMLLIACANLASLQVARAFARSREFAVRSALGGSHRQLMVPLLLESVILALAGGTGGLVVAQWQNDIIGRLLIINQEDGFSIPMDGHVFAFAAASAFISAIAFGLAPAWLAAHAPAAEALKDGSRSATAGRSHQRLKRILIVGQVALALALVGVAASFGVASKRFFQRDLGWQMDGLFNGNLVLPYSRYTEDARVWSFYRTLLDRLSASPGVEHVTIATNLPAYALGRVTRLVVDGQPAPEPGREPTAEVGLISSDYFATLRIPLLQGGYFPPDIKPEDPPIIIVNSAFAQRFWPAGDAIGRRVRFADNDRWLQIVGVVGDVRMAVRPDAPETRLQLYRPLAQSVSRYVGIVLRGAAAPETYAGVVRKAVAELDADLPVARTGAVRALVNRNLSNVNLVVVNLGVSAGMGLLIAAVGLFGVISQLTVQRTRDIGVRIALGAREADILGMVVGDGARMLAIGIVAGVPLFLALNALLRRAMSELPLPGIWLLAVNLVVLAATMLLACYLPARRATRIDPVEALRAE